MLVIAGFGLTAKMMNDVETWTISDEESATISEPLTRILQRIGVNESMNKYADYIGLCTALTITIAPRVIITQVNKKKGETVPNVKKGKTKTSSQKSDTRNNESTTTDNVGSIAESLEYSAF